MFPTETDYRLALGVKMGADAVVTPADYAGIFLLTTREAIHPIEHVVKTTDVREHGMVLVTSDILAVQFAVVIHLYRYHARAPNNALLLVHDNLGRFIPTTNNPFPFLIETHRHGFSPFVT